MDTEKPQNVTSEDRSMEMKEEKGQVLPQDRDQGASASEWLQDEEDWSWD